MTRISSAEAGPSRPIHDMGKSLFWEKKKCPTMVNIYFNFRKRYKKSKRRRIRLL